MNLFLFRHAFMYLPEIRSTNRSKKKPNKQVGKHLRLCRNILKLKYFWKKKWTKERWIFLLVKEKWKKKRSFLWHYLGSNA